MRRTNAEGKTRPLLCQVFHVGGGGGCLTILRPFSLYSSHIRIIGGGGRL